MIRPLMIESLLYIVYILILFNIQYWNWLIKTKQVVGQFKSNHLMSKTRGDPNRFLETQDLINAFPHELLSVLK